MTIVHAETSDEPNVIPCTYAPLADDVAPGNNILLDDGRYRLTVLEAKDGRVRCRVENGGELTNAKGINRCARRDRSVEVDTSWPIGVQGRGMSEECPPSLPSPEPPLTNTSTQGQSNCRKNRTAGIEAP